MMKPIQSLISNPLGWPGLSGPGFPLLLFIAALLRLFRLYFILCLSRSLTCVNIRIEVF